MDNVESVTAFIHPTQAAVVCEPLEQKRRPQNAYDAQFSIPYIVATTLKRGHFTLDELDPEALNDTDALRVSRPMLIGRKTRIQPSRATIPASWKPA